ncbi:MAG: hypothetical protein IPM61_05100 [Chlorobi bacterium]|nr:hypothetical protein [Chlorobiota bacterium]MBX7216259.1 hypothetical protein [Candidatus Kapabacteria bacterium]
MLQAIADRFDIEWDAEAAAEGGGTRAQFREALAERLQHIIDYQFSRLASLFYRIDLDERIVDEIFTTLPQREIPYALADKIIERFGHIMESRRRYREARQNESDDSPAEEKPPIEGSE